VELEIQTQQQVPEVNEETEDEDFDLPYFDHEDEDEHLQMAFLQHRGLIREHDELELVTQYHEVLLHMLDEVDDEQLFRELLQVLVVHDEVDHEEHNQHHL
jgi:hypothetical protein